MRLPTELRIKVLNQNIYLLQLLKPICGHKQPGRVWNQHLVQELFGISFKQSFIYRCVFYQGGVIFIC